MKRLIASILLLGMVATPALAGSFPEKAESRALITSKLYVDDVGIRLPLKRMDQLYRDSGTTMFGGSEPLSTWTGSASVKPIFSPNR